MTKYSFEVKIKVVQDYLEGKCPYLAKKYSIKNTTHVEQSVKSYREFGEEGVFRKRQNERHYVQFKLDAIKFISKVY